jgi:hypothetical protein
MQDFLKTSKVIKDNLEKFDFEATVIDTQLINAAEKVLGIPFPPTYRCFLSEYGSGGKGALEVYGLTRNSSVNFREGSVPNGVWLTLKERKEGRLPSQFIIIGSTGDGFWYALDSSKINAEGEYPVVICGFGENNEGSQKVNEDFGEFFLEQIQQSLDFE